MIRIIISQPTAIPEQPAYNAIRLVNGTFILLTDGNFIERAA